MNIRYVMVSLSLCTGVAQAAAEQKLGAIGTDFDKVLSVPSKLGQTKRAMAILGIKDTIRGLWLYATNSEVRNNIKAALGTNLKDAEGFPVIGAEAYVNVLFKDMPFVSEEKRKQIARVELLFKPNVSLIEYYQQLQDQGILVYVWTDNDLGGYQRKLDALNVELNKLGKRAFVPDGFHCAKLGTKERGYSKVHSEYFRDACNEIMKDNCAALQGKRVLFVDDKIENIESALKAKSEYALDLDAILYDSRKTKLNIVENAVGIQKAISV